MPADVGQTQREHERDCRQQHRFARSHWWLRLSWEPFRDQVGGEWHTRRQTTEMMDPGSESGQKDGGPCGTLPWTGSTSSWKGDSDPAASWAQVRPACWRSAPQLRPCLTSGWMDGSCLDPRWEAIAIAGAGVYFSKDSKLNMHFSIKARTGQTSVRGEPEEATCAILTLDMPTRIHTDCGDKRNPQSDCEG